MGFERDKSPISAAAWDRAMGASDKSDRVLSPTATEPVVSAHSGDAPLRGECPKCSTALKHAGGIGDFCPNPDCEIVDDICGSVSFVNGAAKASPAKPSIPCAVEVRATDFNGFSFDGLPFSDRPEWLLNAIMCCMVSGDNPNCTDYLEWWVNTPTGRVLASPGDKIFYNPATGELGVEKWTPAIADGSPEGPRRETGSVHDSGNRPRSYAQGVEAACIEIISVCRGLIGEGKDGQET